MSESKMLDEAVLDAKHLLETAKKIVAKDVLQKHSEEVKQNLEKILNEEIEEDDFLNDFEMGEEESSEFDTSDAEEDQTNEMEEELINSIPNTVDEEMEIEIDLPDLIKQAELEDLGDEELEDDLEPSEDLEAELEDDEGMELEDDEGMGLDDDLMLEIDDSDENSDENSDDDSDDDIEEEILEMLEIDFGDNTENDTIPGNGELGATSDDIIDTKERARAKKFDNTDDEDVYNKRGVPKFDYDTILERYLKPIIKANIKKDAKISELKKKNAKLFKLLKKSALVNEKQNYLNRILTNSSLNERQKNKMAEVLKKCDTIEKAKLVYETVTKAGLNTSEIKKEVDRIFENKTTQVISSFRKNKKDKKKEKTGAVLIERNQKLAGIIE